MSDFEYDINTIGGRVAYVMSRAGLDIQSFAKTISIDRSQFGKILNNKLGITLKQVLEVSSQYGVRVGWLIDGEEPMYKNEKSAAGIAADHKFISLLQSEVKVMQASLQRLSASLPTPLGPEANELSEGTAKVVSGSKVKPGKH